MICLCAAIPPRERIIKAEEVFELRVPLPEELSMQTRQPNLEGAGDPAAPAGEGGPTPAALPQRRLRVRQEECLDLAQYT